MPQPTSSPDPRPKIRPRRVRFDLSGTPRCWVPGDPQTTHTINVLHLLLPAGERWFVRVLQESLSHIDDPELRETVRGFMGQEATHSRAHDEVLEHLASQGIDAARYTRYVDWLFERLLADRPFGLRLPGGLRRRWTVFRVAIIAAIEHYTAFLGAWMLDESAPLVSEGADGAMVELRRWHAAEEVEHRTVAYDAAVYLGTSRAERAIAMLLTTATITFLWQEGTRFLMRSDPGVRREPTYRAFLRAGRKGLLPTAKALFSSVPHYFSLGYHPSEIGKLESALRHLSILAAH